ncbi:Biopolymer transport protein ExbD/TolR [gamma proteobacterium IMCC2047]|nr:Biopolymer transport protein ExbD/TolR [gamma proteobacterium IMCC2047]
MKFRRQRGEEIGVNLTPLIDVVFLLLIFFMVSTTFKKETHISLNLPEAEGEQVKAENNQIEIVISAKGEFSINERALINNEFGTLRAAIKKVGKGDTELPVIISADGNAPHQAVVNAMDAAGQLGYSRLSITTRQRDVQ